MSSLTNAAELQTRLTYASIPASRITLETGDNAHSIVYRYVGVAPDKLISCVMCAHNSVGTLDHYLHGQKPSSMGLDCTYQSCAAEPSVSIVTELDRPVCQILSKSKKRRQLDWA